MIHKSWFYKGYIHLDGINPPFFHPLLLQFQDDIPLQQVAEYLGLPIPKRPPVPRLDSSQALEDETQRPIATPARAALPPLEVPVPTRPVPEVSGQLTLEELGACQFKPYPNQPNLPPRLPSKDSMRQLTCWDLPKFLNGAKVESPGSTVATTVIESTGSATSPSAPTHEAFQRLSKSSVSKHMHDFIPFFKCFLSSQAVNKYFRPR